MVEDILYFEQHGRKAKIQTKHGSFEVYQKISYYAELLKQYRFIQCHKSFVINMNEVTELDRNAASISNMEIIPISRTYQNNIRDFLENEVLKLIARSPC